MANKVFIAVSLDGFIAREDGSIDWLDRFSGAPGNDYGYGDFISSVDAIVIGRGTYESVLRLSPRIWTYNKPVFVLSNSLAPYSDEQKRLTILSLSPGQLVDRLSEEGYSNLYIDGGKTIQRFLAADLIDEITITRVPLILGTGIPLFADHHGEFRLEHVSTTAYPNGLVQSRYRAPRID